MRILVSRAVESPTPRLLHHHHRRHARIFILRGKKWAGVCNVILHKQDQLIFMLTGERERKSLPRRIENNKNRTGQTNGYEGTC